MKYKNIIYGFVVIGLMIWALMDQASEHPKIWIQVVGVAVFFYAMARLMQKTPSNTPREINKIQEEIIEGEDYSITEVHKKNKTE